MAKDDGGLLGAALDVFKAGANEVDIFTSDKSGPNNTSGSGNHTSEPNSMSGGWSGGSSESSGNTTHHRSTKGRLTGETVKNGNRLDHFGPPGTFGIGGRDFRGHSDINGNRVDHFDNHGNWVGWSQRHDDGKIENFDRQSELRHVTWGSPDNAVAVELNTGSSPGWGGGWSGSSARVPRPSIRISPAFDNAIAYVAGAVFVLLIVAYLGFMIFGSSSGSKSHATAKARSQKQSSARADSSDQSKRLLGRAASGGKQYSIFREYNEDNRPKSWEEISRIGQDILDGKVRIHENGDVEQIPLRERPRPKGRAPSGGKQYGTFREYQEASRPKSQEEISKIGQDILDGKVTVLEDGTVIRK